MQGRVLQHTAGSVLPTPPRASSPSRAPFCYKTNEDAYESSQKALSRQARCCYTNEGLKDLATAVPAFPPPAQRAATCLHALVQNKAINSNQARYCREKLPETTQTVPSPPCSALTSVKAALM